MFLRNFEQAEQQAFIYLANEVIKADSKIDEIELDFLSALQNEFSEMVEYKENQISEEDAIQALAKYSSKVSAIIELIGIAHIDGNYATEEKEYLRGVSQKLGISEEKFDHLENWVLKQSALLDEAKHLLSEDVE
jgi:tellurite resistance protein